MRCRSRKLKLALEVTRGDLKELWERQGGRCTLTGWSLSQAVNDLRRGSIDRIDSSKGYIKGNIQFVAWIVNAAKGKFSQSDFVEMCGAVGNFQ